MADSRDLHSSFTTSYTRKDPETDSSGNKKGITLSQVDGTSCDNIEFLLYNKKGLFVNLATTTGSFMRVADKFFDMEEAVSITGGKTTGVSVPGVILVTSIEPVGNVLVLKDEKMSVTSGHFVFDMEAEEVKYTGPDDVYAVVRIKYRSQGTQYRFNWGGGTAKDAQIVAIAGDGTKASLQVSRAECEDEEDDEEKKYGDAASENTQLQFPLEMEVTWAMLRYLELGPQPFYAMTYLYPVLTTATLEFKASFGKTGTLIPCTFTEDPGAPAYKEIFESVNFSSSPIVNVRYFIDAFANMTITAESSFFDLKGNRIMSPNFKGPGDYVTIEEERETTKTMKDPLSGQDRQIKVKQTVRFTKILGPTEVAIVTALGVVLPATGVARVNYKVPMKSGLFKLNANLTDEIVKEWRCEVYGSYLYRDFEVSEKNIVFMGTVSIPCPMSASPALDARELKLQERISL